MAIYLCDAVTAFKGSPCGATVLTTPAQQQALSDELQQDSRIVSYVFVSADAQYALGQRTMPSVEAAQLRPGVLPAAYFVALDSSAESQAVIAAYKSAPGVSAVSPCVRQPQCQVSQLRAVGNLK